MSGITPVRYPRGLALSTKYGLPDDRALTNVKYLHQRAADIMSRGKAVSILYDRHVERLGLCVRQQIPQAIELLRFIAFVLRQTGRTAS